MMTVIHIIENSIGHAHSYSVPNYYDNEYIRLDWNFFHMRYFYTFFASTSSARHAKKLTTEANLHLVLRDGIIIILYVNNTAETSANGVICREYEQP